jgi:hypothetical protein
MLPNNRRVRCLRRCRTSTTCVCPSTIQHQTHRRLRASNRQMLFTIMRLCVNKSATRRSPGVAAGTSVANPLAVPPLGPRPTPIIQGAWRSYPAFHPSYLCLPTYPRCAPGCACCVQAGSTALPTLRAQRASQRPAGAPGSEGVPLSRERRNLRGPGVGLRSAEAAWVAPVPPSAYLR